LAESNRQRLNVIAVANIEDPKRFANLVTVKDWQPVNTEIKVGDVARLVTRLGGVELYGKDYTVPLRELIQNSFDAIKAKRALEDDLTNAGQIIVRKGSDKDGLFLEIEDDGVGMSERVLTGPFLDFGQSFWGTRLMHEELPGLESKPFEPTGKYGIGFYSIFMISERVSIFSRRFEDAWENTSCLEFSSGVKTRPILRKAMPNETMKKGGTKVRAYINSDTFRDILSQKRKSRETWTLKEIIKRLCISLNANVYYQEDNQNIQKLIEADDWKTISPVELVQRIVGETNYENASSISKDIINAFCKHIECIQIGNEIIGRACIIKDPYYKDDMPDLHGAVTVNGLYTDRLQYVLGVFCGKNLSASRDLATPLLTNTTLTTWANSQAIKIENSEFIPVDTKRELACIIRRLGGDTKSLPVAKHNRQYVTYTELVQILKKKRVPIFIVSEYFIRNIEESLKGQFTVKDNVIEISSTSYPIQSYSRRKNQSEIWPPSLKFYQWSYESLMGALIEAVSEAWEIDEADVVRYIGDTYESYQDVVIGSINGKEIYEQTNTIDPSRIQTKIT